MAEEMDVPFLGAIPIDPEVCALADRGMTFAERETIAGESFREIVDRLLEAIKEPEQCCIASLSCLSDLEGRPERAENFIS